MAWSWMGGASEWTIPLPNVPIPQHQESTWADQLTMVVGAAAVAAEGGETPTMTVVATIAMTDMTSMTIGIVAGALHHPTTVDTGLAHGLAPTAHGDTKLFLPTFSFPPLIGGVFFIKVFLRGKV